MDTSPRMPSPSKMHIIVFMLHNEIITFKSQLIYKNNISFKKAMHELHDKELVLTRHENGSPNEYKLSDKGKYFAMILDEFTK